MFGYATAWESGSWTLLHEESAVVWFAQKAGKDSNISWAFTSAVLDFQEFCRLTIKHNHYKNLNNIDSQINYIKAFNLIKQ